MSISLKTHTVYPEIQYNPETEEAVGILYDVKGVVMFKMEGTAVSRKDASEILSIELAKVATKYKKEVTK